MHVASIRHFSDYSLQTALEVANDLGIEPSGLNYLGKNAFLGSKRLYGINDRRTPIVIH